MLSESCPVSVSVYTDESQSETEADLASQPTTGTEPSPFNDIGTILDPALSAENICLKIINLSNDEKYTLLFDHVTPPSSLPYSNIRGCNRKFNTVWLEKYPWLKYSTKLNGVFCGPCALLLSTNERKEIENLVNRSFSNWAKLSSILSNHSSLHYHCKSMQDADILKMFVKAPQSRIDIMTSAALCQRIEHNKNIIFRAIRFLAKQGLPF